MVWGWGLGIGDWGLGIGDWAQSPIPNPHPQTPNPNPQMTYNFIKNSKIKCTNKIQKLKNEKIKLKKNKMEDRLPLLFQVIK